jgi:hypothetical protein
MRYGFDQNKIDNSDSTENQWYKGKISDIVQPL